MSGAIVKQKALTERVKREIVEDISFIDWKNLYGGSTPSKRIRRDFIWGMAIHNLSDTFAHDAVVNGKRIKHAEKKATDADNPRYYPERWDCAVHAVEIAIKKYNSSSYESGGWSEYYTLSKEKSFKIINIYENVKEIFGENIARNFKSKSKSMK